MQNSKLKIGLIGVGYWGKNLLRVLSSSREARLQYICDKNKKVLEKLKIKYSEIRLSKSIESVIKDEDVEAVVIATPASTHYRLAKRALEKGKDVFVEKPLALKLDQAKILEKLAKKKKKVLMVGHILQYHPAVVKLKRLISKGRLGKLQYIYSNRLNIGKLRSEENILWSFAPHDISAILMLLGQEPVKVSAFGEDCLKRRIYDTTLTMLEFKNGLKGHIFVNWLHPYKEQKLIVVGSKMMAVFDDLNQNKLSLYPHKIEWRKGRMPLAQKAKHYSVKIAKKEPLKQEIKHFIDCVTKKKRPKTDAQEGLRVLRVLELAERSLRRQGG